MHTIDFTRCLQSLDKNFIEIRYYQGAMTFLALHFSDTICLLIDLDIYYALLYPTTKLFR